MTAKRRKRARWSARRIGWLVAPALVVWPVLARFGGYEPPWFAVLGSSLGYALLVILLLRFYRAPWAGVSSLPRTKVPMAERLAKQPPIQRTRQVKTVEKLLPVMDLEPDPEEAVLLTPKTRLQAKLGAAAEFADLHGFGPELQQVWNAVDDAAAEQSDKVSQREVETWSRKPLTMSADEWLQPPREAS